MFSRNAIRYCYITLALLALMLATVPIAHAATLTVTSTGDGAANAANCPGASCRLRDAIKAASDGDTIVFDPSVTGTITLSSGTLFVNKNVTITGPGATTLSINGANTYTVFTIDFGKTGTISGLTITNGNGAPFDVGGIRANGNLILDQVAVTGNSEGNAACVGCDGGGIFVNSNNTATITNSTISGNTVRGSSVGGGIGTSTNVTLTLTNVTISGNTAPDAGGDGGGIAFISGTANLNNVTITNNSATRNGGGLYHQGGTVNIKNTIIAGNTATTSGPDCRATLNSQGYNLIQNTSGCTITGTTTGNITGQNPQLGALANNGGTTQTHALLNASPAINAGSTATCAATDQRGFNRRSGFCDIGAFEAQAASLTATSGTPQSATVNTAFTNALQANVKDANTNNLGGVVVNFSAPVSGASASLSSGMATTNLSGNASVTATANGAGGAYIVSASVAGAGSVNFSLTNTLWLLNLPLILR